MNGKIQGAFRAGRLVMGAIFAFAVLFRIPIMTAAPADLPTGESILLIRAETETARLTPYSLRTEEDPVSGVYDGMIFLCSFGVCLAAAFLAFPTFVLSRVDGSGGLPRRGRRSGWTAGNGL